MRSTAVACPIATRAIMVASSSSSCTVHVEPCHARPAQILVKDKGTVALTSFSPHPGSQVAFDHTKHRQSVQCPSRCFRHSGNAGRTTRGASGRTLAWCDAVAAPVTRASSFSPLDPRSVPPSSGNGPIPKTGETEGFRPLEPQRRQVPASSR